MCFALCGDIMIEQLYQRENYVVAKKLLDAAHDRHQALAGNIANAQVSGHKGETVVFRSFPDILFDQQSPYIDKTSQANHVTGRIGTGVGVDWSYMNFQPGPLEHTGVNTDLTIDGDGFFVVETGNGTMVNSSYTARRLIDDLDAKDTLKVLWDPANNCWCHERAWPDGYDELRGGYLGHVHIKDVQVDTPRATLEVRAMGEGQLAPMFAPIAAALRADGYGGVISLESVYHPGNGDFEAGFRRCIGPFKEIFGG